MTGTNELKTSVARLKIRWRLIVVDGSSKNGSDSMLDAVSHLTNLAGIAKYRKDSREEIFRTIHPFSKLSLEMESGIGLSFSIEYFKVGRSDGTKDDIICIRFLNLASPSAINLMIGTFKLMAIFILVYVKNLWSTFCRNRLFGLIIDISLMDLSFDGMEKAKE